jgi:hypothetical protein
MGFWMLLVKLLDLFYFDMKRATVIQLFANEIFLETAIRIPYLRCQMLQTWLHWLQA